MTTIPFNIETFTDLKLLSKLALTTKPKIGNEYAIIVHYTNPDSTEFITPTLKTVIVQSYNEADNTIVLSKADGTLLVANYSNNQLTQLIDDNYNCDPNLLEISTDVLIQLTKINEAADRCDEQITEIQNLVATFQPNHGQLTPDQATEFNNSVAAYAKLLVQRKHLIEKLT